MMRAADLVVLCLPDDAAREAVALADSLGAKAPKIVDASTAHRVAPGWVYGFAELEPDQPGAIKNATRVANPGCYPTGGIALIRPLVDAGIIPADYPVTVNAVSGYSGGGRSMIEAYEAGTAPSFELYGLGLEHKHVPELQKYSRLTRRPIFVPSVGNFRQGMLVSVPLHLDTLTGRASLADLEAVLAGYYKGSELISVVPGAAGKITRLEAEALNGTDKLEVFVFGKPGLNQAVLIARLDNLGKGAAGAAVQNIKLMLGLD
jgi:N-acetyl-gamma-glutamyl-phosphate reductase